MCRRKIQVGEGRETLVWFQKEGGGRPLCTGKGRLAASPGSLWFLLKGKGGRPVLFCFWLRGDERRLGLRRRKGYGF